MKTLISICTVLFSSILLFSCTETLNNTDDNTVDYSGTTGTEVNQEGNEFKWVGIGTQIWMAENLDVTSLNDGTQIPNITDDVEWSNLYTPSYVWYANEPNYRDSLGAMYNWYALETQKLCPEGWHIPNTTEWETLKQYLSDNGNEGHEGTALKALIGWGESGNGTDLYGFSAMPVGYRSYDGTFMNTNSAGSFASFWSTTVTNPATADGWEVASNNTTMSKNPTFKSIGRSVRCIKD